MSAFWFKFKKFIKYQFKSGNPWLHTFLFVASLSVFFGAVNTSFHVMGVDISEFRSLIYGLIPLILKDLSGVLFVSYAFFSAFSILLLGPDWDRYSDGRTIRARYQYALLGTGLFLLFCSSVSKYPQVYGEFFYYRQSWALGFLYFLTDHIPPWFPLSLLVILILIQIGRKILNSLEKNNILSVARFLLFLLFFYGFHSIGSATGVLASSLAYSWAPSLKKRRYEFLLSSILAVGFFLGYCVKISPRFVNKSSDVTRASSPITKSTNMNILVLAADSIRQDQLGYASGKKGLTPNIDALAKESRIFLDHHTTIPRTFPAWADLLSGCYSFNHGIQDMFPDKKDRSSLGVKIPTLGSILSQEAGYRTVVVSSFAGDIFPRANWGFDEIYAPNFNAGTLTQERTLESQVYLLPLLTGAFFGGGEYLSSVRSLPTLGDDNRILPDLFRVFEDKKSPFFAVYFSSVTHFPYSPPYPFYKEEGNSNYYGPSKYFRFVDPSDSKKPGPEEQEQIRAIYRASLRAFDDAVGKILHELKKKNLYDNTLILLTSDHGESLFEDVHSHGHGEHLRGEGVTKVPLLLKFPKYFETETKTGIFQGITSSLDVFPTVLSIVGIHQPAEIVYPGRDLSKAPARGDWSDPRKIYSETGIWFSDRGDHFFQKNRIRYPNILELHSIDPEDGDSVTISDPYAKETIAFAKHRMIQDKHRKLVYIPRPEGVDYECYDRIADPWSQKPISAIYCEDLKRELEKILVGSGKWKKAGDYFLPITN
ncbi:type I phosphodiesterase/nucleotide pyrophosphatase [Leptospira broomii serovar Hurstbridge str. 5399]|uniref:Type I phosphodiesterase/nucleotide pyrophosphatase n=1 Tax=Leptospira broomii serovar Hurstbridge str. 5399 TaxID=1049789 RepID=T0FDZ6_9LEPT|nr:sulfatase-like hydrolase/transferase [Leptospira broomii]EQA45842.1 type I phosphodiesterase/nucleotide pyrophosphatase [Leptospira broomii serovar Hurstbridge str. 5399]